MYRVGLGTDSHRLEDEGPLRLGGIDIPAEKHAVGHSDADALVHAVIDALLGALALPDIGELFPNTSAENRDRNSLELLAEVTTRLAAEGWAVENLDSVITLEAPRLSDYKSAIRSQLAKTLEVDSHRINVKAKTAESLGAVGRGEAIEAQCVVLLKKKDRS